MHFHIVSAGPIEMRTGALIDYRLSVRGFPVRWRTKITVWEPPLHFVDEQIRGPYQLWRHEHEFESANGGTLVRDHVHYAVPFDFLVHGLFVRRDIEQIFAYRTERLLAHFAPPSRIDVPPRAAAPD